MENEIYRVVGPSSMSSSISEIVVKEGGQVSAPQPSASTSDPLNAPVTGGDIQAAAVVITALFGAGTAGAAFLRQLIALAKDYKGRVTVTNTKTGNTTRIDENTKVDDIR